MEERYGPSERLGLDKGCAFDKGPRARVCVCVGVFLSVYFFFERTLPTFMFHGLMRLFW